MDPAPAGKDADQAVATSDPVRHAPGPAPPAQAEIAPEEPGVHSEGRPVGSPIPPVEGFDPEAWHFDIHGNLISAPPAAYENMEVQQLHMQAPMHQAPHSLPPQFYQHPPPSHAFRPAGVPAFPVGTLPVMPYPCHQQQPDLADMFQAQANVRPSHHKKSGSHGRNSPPLCRFFAQGRCRNGSQCHFSHEQGARQQPGKQGHSNGRSGTQNGRGEKFGPHHNRHGQYSNDQNHHANGLPPSRRACRYYVQGNCRNGSNCRFLHGAGSSDSTSSTLASASEPASPTPESQVAAPNASQTAAA